MHEREPAIAPGEKCGLGTSGEPLSPRFGVTPAVPRAD
jgi:hypothetical protein